MDTFRAHFDPHSCTDDLLDDLMSLKIRRLETIQQLGDRLAGIASMLGYDLNHPFILTVFGRALPNKILLLYSGAIALNLGSRFHGTDGKS